MPTPAPIFGIAAGEYLDKQIVGPTVAPPRRLVVTFLYVFLLLRRLTNKLSIEAGNGNVTNPK